MRTRSRHTLLAGVAIIAIATVSAAGAHHSFASFDRTKQVTLTGTIKEFQWTNPHAWIQVLVPDDEGGTTEWSVECGSPNMMARTGWKKTTLAPGAAVSVTINPLLEGGSSGSLVAITLADGTVLGPGDAPPLKPLGAARP
jgi:hypothetical protein